MRVVTAAAGIPFSALTWGDPSARPLVLIHGVTSSAAIWWRVGPALAATGRRVVALDLPGHGRTGHWTGRPRFGDMAADVAAWIRAAGLDRPDLQVVGHSYGAMTTAALPRAGLRPATIVLLDPPVLPLDVMARLVDDPTERTYDDLDERSPPSRPPTPNGRPATSWPRPSPSPSSTRRPPWPILLENGDWDGGLADLADPAADGIEVWIVKGEAATGSHLPDAALPAFLGAPRCRPHPDHPGRRALAAADAIEATLAALLRALG